MALTDHCDLFGAFHEEGFNRIVDHIRFQRPSMFNYATQAIADLWIHYKDEQAPDIDHVIDDLVKRFPACHDVRLIAYNHYSKRGKTEEAQRHLLTGLALYPESPLLLIQLEKALRPEEPEAADQIRQRADRMLFKLYGRDCQVKI